MSQKIHIKLNERAIDIDTGTTLFDLRDRRKPNADVLVLNGAPITEDVGLVAGDEVVLIQRGNPPDEHELESLMAARHTPGVHAQLKKAVVGIAGLGGLGSAIAIALARIGVGRLVLADFDIVEPSNLNRQQFFVDQIGMYKTDALRDNLSRINPYVRIETHTVRLTPQNIPTIFKRADVMVEAFDSAEQKAMIVETFRKAYPATTIVAATGLAGHMPSNTIRTQKFGPWLVVVGDMVTAAQQGVGLMAPRVGVAAHHQANAVLRILLGLDPEKDPAP